MIFEKGILILQLWETIVLMWLPGQVCSISMQNPPQLTTPNKNSEFLAKSGDGKCCNQHFQIDSFLPLPTNQLVYQDSHGSTFFFRNWISTKSLPKSAIGGLSFSPRYLVYTSSLPKVQTRKSGEFFWPSEMDQLSKETPLTTLRLTPRLEGWNTTGVNWKTPGPRHPNHGFLGPQSSSFFAVWANSSAWNLLQAQENLKSSQASVVRCLFFLISRGFGVQKLRWNPGEMGMDKKQRVSLGLFHPCGCGVRILRFHLEFAAVWCLEVGNSQMLVSFSWWFATLKKKVKRFKSPNNQMGVSENRGTPKSSILVEISIINHPFWGTPIFGNTQMLLFSDIWKFHGAVGFFFAENPMAVTPRSKVQRPL